MEKRWGDSLKAEERKTKQQNREVTVQWMRQLKGGYRKEEIDIRSFILPIVTVTDSAGFFS